MTRETLKKFFTIFFFAIFFFVVIAGLTARFDSKKSTTEAVQINDTVLHIERAITPAEQEVGMAKFDSIPDDFGMLFVFEKPGRYAFWMKNMRFPIDIFWLDENKQIIHIEKSVFPDTYPAIFEPSDEALYVLETAAGFSEKEKIKVGDTIGFLD